MTVNTSAIRKAAILIDCLDRETASMLLREIRLKTAREIHQLSSNLAGVTREEKERVLAEFLERVQTRSEQVPLHPNEQSDADSTSNQYPITTERNPE